MTAAPRQPTSSRHFDLSPTDHRENARRSQQLQTRITATCGSEDSRFVSESRVLASEKTRIYSSANT